MAIAVPANSTVRTQYGSCTQLLQRAPVGSVSRMTFCRRSRCSASTSRVYAVSLFCSDSGEGVAHEGLREKCSKSPTVACHAPKSGQPLCEQGKRSTHSNFCNTLCSMEGGDMDGSLCCSCASWLCNMDRASPVGSTATQRLASGDADWDTTVGTFTRHFNAIVPAFPLPGSGWQAVRQRLPGDAPARLSPTATCGPHWSALWLCVSRDGEVAQRGGAESAWCMNVYCIH